VATSPFICFFKSFPCFTNTELHGSCSIRVSNELGAGRPWNARLAVRVVLVLAIIEGIIVGTVMILVRNIWGYAYSNEVEVVEYVATMFPILAASNFLDGLQCVLSGFSFPPLLLLVCTGAMTQKHWYRLRGILELPIHLTYKNANSIQSIDIWLLWANTRKGTCVHSTNECM